MRWLKREASICMRSAKWRTWSASSLADSTASASSARAPTGVFNSWLTLATKSLRTTSTRRSSARSSIKTRIAPVPNGATRTRSSSSSRPSGGRRTRISCSRACPSSTTRSMRWLTSGTVTSPRLTKPRALARELARRTVPSGATTSEADGRTLRTRMTSSGIATEAGRALVGAPSTG